MAWRKPQASLGVLAAVAFLAATLNVQASASAIVNLGKPTNDAPTSYYPLGGFHHVPDHLTFNNKPVVEYMETSWDDWSAAVGWPLVKALDQFGRFSGVKPLSENCPNTLPTPVPTVFTQTPPGAQLDIVTAGCGTPGFDFSHAGYRSSYISLRIRILMDRAGKTHVKSLSAAELKIYDKYARTKLSRTNEAQNIAASVYGFPLRVQRLPLLLIGHYVQRKDEYVLPRNDFGTTFRSPTEQKNYFPSLSFSAAQTALATHHNPRPASDQIYQGSILPDVNTDANLMIALICRADGSKPSKVCGRSVIRKILKHAR